MISVRGSGIYVPPGRIGPTEIADRYGAEAAETASRTGVTCRYYAGAITQIEMGVAAAQKALAEAGLAAEAVDLIVSASAIPYQAIPGTAALYADALGCPDGRCATFDVNSTCLSFVTAFDLAATLLDAGQAATVLVISAEIASSGLPWHDDPETAALFGDGAAAFVLTRGATRIAARGFETHASAWQACQVAVGGTGVDVHDPDTDYAAQAFFRMQKRDLFKLTAARFPAFVDRILARAGWEADQISRIIPHQGSPLGLRHVMRICRFPAETFVDIASDYGNMIAASIPFVLARERAAGRVRAGDRVLLLGTSAGVSFGAMALEIAE